MRSYRRVILDIPYSSADRHSRGAYDGLRGPEDTRYRHLINAVKTGGRIGRIVYTTTDDPDYEGIKDSI